MIPDKVSMIDIESEKLYVCDSKINIIKNYTFKRAEDGQDNVSNLRINT